VSYSKTVDTEQLIGAGVMDGLNLLSGDCIDFSIVVVDDVTFLFLDNRYAGTVAIPEITQQGGHVALAACFYDAGAISLTPPRYEDFVVKSLDHLP